MVWANLFSLLVSLALYILQYMERQKIRTEENIRVLRKVREDTDEFIRRATEARSNVDHSSGAVLADGDNRDNNESNKGADPQSGV